jgi:hypothetical protein
MIRAGRSISRQARQESFIRSEVMLAGRCDNPFFCGITAGGGRGLPIDVAKDMVGSVESRKFSENSASRYH